MSAPSRRLVHYLNIQGSEEPPRLVANHNFGIAWDIGIFKGGAYLPESPLYTQAGQIGRQQGLEWGGDWKSFKDEPHFNLKTGLTIAQLRSAFLKGEAYV